MGATVTAAADIAATATVTAAAAAYIFYMNFAAAVAEDKELRNCDVEKFMYINLYV